MSYILQLHEMCRKKIAVLIGSLQAAVVSLLALLQLYGTLRENWKIKESTEIHSLPFNSKFNSHCFFPELDILNVNPTSQISLYL